MAGQYQLAGTTFGFPGVGTDYRGADFVVGQLYAVGHGARQGRLGTLVIREVTGFACDRQVEAGQFHRSCLELGEAFQAEVDSCQPNSRVRCPTGVLEPVDDLALGKALFDLGQNLGTHVVVGDMAFQRDFAVI